MSIKGLSALGEFALKQIAQQLAAEKKRAKPKPVMIPKDEFDSELERRYYNLEIFPRLASGEYVSCEAHKTFLLLGASEYCGIRLSSAEYTPDFCIRERGGVVRIIEVKSKAVRRLQKSYVYRRRLFIELYCRPNGWIFEEIIE